MLYEIIISPPWLILIMCVALFFFGATVASFFDVVRLRKSWRHSLRGRSHCASCRKTLTWRELVPILSYLSLRGKCASCSASIPVYHLCAEILSGALFIYIFLFADSLFTIGIGVLSAVFLVPIVLEDIERMEVPEHFSVPFAYSALGIAVAVMLQTGDITPAMSAVLLAAPFYILWLCTGGRAMGLGDAKVAIALGMLLPSLLGAVSVFIFTFWLGTLGVLGYMAYKKISTGRYGIVKHMHMPLVPAMAAAYFIVLINGTSVLDILTLF